MPKTVAIEISELDAKIVQIDVTKKQGLLLDAALRVSFDDLPKGAEGQTARAQRLKEALKQHKVALDNAALVIPKQSATLRKVRLPSGDPEEVASMVTFEAEKIIPFNVERHIVSHRVLRQHDIEGSDVLIAAVDEPVMTGYYSTCRAAGCDPVTAMVSSLALGAGLLHVLPEEKKQQSFAVLNVGMAYTDISIFCDGVIVTARSVLHGVRNLQSELQSALGLENQPELTELSQIDNLQSRNARTQPIAAQAEPGDSDFVVMPSHDEPEEKSQVAEIVKRWVAKLVTNLQRTYEFALREYSPRPIEIAYLTGEGAMVQNVASYVHQHLGIAVGLYDPFEDVKPSPKAIIQENAALCCANAYGAAWELAHDNPEELINLLPPSVMESRRRAELRLHFLATGTLALVTAIILFIWIDMRGDIKTENIERYSVYSDDLQELVAEVDEMKERMEIIRNIRSERAGTLQILEELSKYEPIATNPPGRMTLDHFDFTINDRMRVTGIAMDNADINKFVQFLRTLKDEQGNLMFQTAEIVSQEPKNLSGRNRTVYAFDITAQLRSRNN